MSEPEPPVQPPAEPPAAPEPDAAREAAPAPETPSPETPAKRSHWPAIAGLLGMNLVLFALLGGFAFYAWKTAPERKAMNADVKPQLATLDDRIAALEAAASAGQEELSARLAALDAKLAAQPEAGAPAPADTVALDALAQRVTALETRPAPAAPDTTALEKRLTALEAAKSEEATAAAERATLAGRIAALEKKLAEDVTPALETLKMRPRDPATEAALKDLGARLAALEARDPSGALRNASAAYAATVLAEAVRAGEPYGDELGAVTRLAPVLPDLPALTRHAARGVRSADDLARQFPAVARAARKAADAEAGDKDQTLLGRLTALFGDLVTVRTPGQGHEAVLSAMAKAVERGELRQALAAARDADPATAAALAPWLAEARAHEEALGELRTLKTAVLLELGTVPPQETGP